MNDISDWHRIGKRQDNLVGTKVLCKNMVGKLFCNIVKGTTNCVLFVVPMT